MARDYAALPYEYIDELDELSDEEFGRLIRGLLAYSRDGKAIEAEGNERYYAKRVMNREDRYQESFGKVDERRSQAARKAANKRWEQSDASRMPTHANACERMPSDANGCVRCEAKAETKAETETKAEGEKESKEKKAAGAASTTAGSAKPKETQEEMYERLATVFEPGVVTDRLDHEIRLWLRYKTERKEAYKESGMAALLRKIVLDETLKHGEKKVCDLIEECMASGYRGIIWDRLDKPQGSGPGSRGRPDIVEQMRDW